MLAVAVHGTPAQAQSLTWQDASDERGVVVMMRHALAPGGGDPPGFRLSDCRTQRNLSRDGRQQARAIGRLIESSGIRVSRVLSSPWCRAKETAALLDVGPVRTIGYLGSTFTAPSAVSAARKERTLRLIESHRGKAGVLLLVGHYANIQDLTGLTTDSGEAIAVRMNDDRTLEFLGRIASPPRGN